MMINTEAIPYENETWNSLMNAKNFPLITAVFAKSSNAQQNTVSALAVIDVNATKNISLDTLSNLLDLRNLSDPLIIPGFSYSTSKVMTKADRAIKAYKRYERSQNFKVIWLCKEHIQSGYHGNAGFVLWKLSGLVLEYPEELMNN